MMKGNILYAVSNGHYLLRLIGDVRANLCTTMNDFSDHMFRSAFKSILIDLTETECIDSTSLGFLAKISLKTRQLRNEKAGIISTNPDINCILHSMGFDQVFDIFKDEASAKSSFNHKGFNLFEQAIEITESYCGDPETINAYSHVLEAHRCLMELNKRNHKTFKPLVDALEIEHTKLNTQAKTIASQSYEASSLAGVARYNTNRRYGIDIGFCNKSSTPDSKPNPDYISPELVIHQ